MEHNEYALYRVKYTTGMRTGYHENHEDFVNTGVVKTVREANVIAPADEKLARPLIEYTLKHGSWGDENNFEITSMESEKIDHIIRFENSYRARL